MNQIIPYLVFPGNCKEAMEHYANILNGTITSMMTFKESPIPAPEIAHERIYNSELKAGDLTIKASDDMPGYEVNAGSNFSLFLTFDDDQTKITTFNKLSEGGQVQFPIDDNFGMCKDKYGVQWMVVGN